MSVRLLVADALHLIDEHASAMPEGAYLELMNKMKSIHDQVHDQVHEPGAPEDIIGHLVGNNPASTYVEQLMKRIFHILYIRTRRRAVPATGRTLYGYVIYINYNT